MPLATWKKAAVAIATWKKVAVAIATWKKAAVAIATWKKAAVAIAALIKASAATEGINWLQKHLLLKFKKYSSFLHKVLYNRATLLNKLLVVSEYLQTALQLHLESQTATSCHL